jgi:hypothetical protein
MDSNTGIITHYFDGQPVGKFGRGVAVPMCLDTFEIGNWAIHAGDPHLGVFDWGTTKDTIRNFRGRIDEFAILSRVLNADEVQKIYLAGRPGELIVAPQ